MRQSLLVTLVAAAILISSPSFGETRFGSISSGGLYLDAAASKLYEQLINERLLDIGIDPERSEFKVPATNIVRYICTPVQMAGGAVNPCGKLQLQTTLECPTSIEMVWPGGETKTVPIHCTGPDAQGNCECELGSAPK